MRGNILPNDGEMPQGLCLSRSKTMFDVLLHGQGKEKGSSRDGEGGTTAGETTQGWHFSGPSKTELLCFRPCLHFPLGKWLMKSLS